MSGSSFARKRKHRKFFGGGMFSSLPSGFRDNRYTTGRILPAQCGYFQSFNVVPDRVLAYQTGK